MKHRLLALPAVLLVLLFSSHFAFADPIPIGFISFDVVTTNPITFAPATAEFDITNLTGANADGVTFLVATPLTLSNLSLTVTYLNGKTETFGSSYFTSDGLGDFNGTPLSTTLSYPFDGFGNAVSATLTGDVNTKLVNFTDGTSSAIALSFSATDTGDGTNGVLQDQDLAIINVTPTPEPSALILAGTGFMGLFLVRRRLFSGSSKAAAAVAVGAVLMASAHAGMAQSVKLTAAASPSSGSSGVTTVAVTGSGFPSGTIPAANVTVSVASSCAGSGALAPATSVVKVISTTERVQFVIPASLSSGTYYVSLSGTTSTGTSFASVSCAQVGVTGSSPTATLSASTVSFPSTTAGIPDATQQVALSNTGTGVLNISNISLGGTGAGQFSESNNCPATLAVGAYCTITAGFSPLTPGSYSASVTVSDNDPSATQTITLGGSAIAPFLSGNVYGGTQPISGATVTLWSAGSSSTYGAGATSLATTTTNASGAFIFANGGVSLCTAGQSLYVTSVGGSSGSGTNPYAALMAALPAPCSSATPGTSLVLNEVTTVASVTALQQFMTIAPGGTPAWTIGTPVANVTGMVNAFTQVGNLVAPATGTSGPVTATNVVGSVTYTTTITPDTAKINTLADILAACVATDGTGACGTLFTATTPTGSVSPSDTIQVAYNLATNAGGVTLPNSPGEPAYLAGAYVTASSPFQPYIASPTDWTIDVHWTASNGTATVGTAAAPSVAIDAAGNIWTSSLNSSTTGLGVTEFNPAGQVQFTPPTTAPVVGGWQYKSCTTCTTPVNLGGTHTGDAIAIDTNGNAWATSWNGSTNTIASQLEAPVVQVTPAGVASAYLVGFSPSGISIDGNNNLYVEDGPTSGRYYESELQATPAPAYSTLDEGTGRSTTYYWSSTIDQAGFVWPAINNGETSIPRITNTGAASTVGSTTALPAAVYYLAADASNNAWGATGANTVGKTGLEYINVSSSIASPTVTSFPVGTNGSTQGGLYAPQGMAIDGTGNLWVVNSNGAAGGGISEFVPSNNGTTLTPLSPSGTGVWGFFSGASLNNPIGAAIDGSGNVWLKTKGGSSLYYLVGAASPVVTPLATMAKTGFIGERPGATLLATLSSSLTFNALTTGNQSQTATFTNAGTSAIKVTGTTITGANASDFSVTGTTCGQTLAIGASCSFTVTFASTTPGSFSAALNVNGNAVVTPGSATLTAMSDTPVPFTVTAGGSASTPPSITFSPIVAGSVSLGQALVVTNNGSVPLSLSIAMGGTGANLFPQTSNCGSSLAAGASCDVGLIFAPKVAGSYSASLTLTDNAGSGSQVVPISGTANAFNINVNTSSTNWVINNGAITYNWNSSSGNLISWILNGYPDQLIDINNASDGLYMDNTGTFDNMSVPTGGTAATGVISCTYVGATLTGTNNCTKGTGTTPYFDWSITYPDSPNSGNTYTFSQHWLVFPNDPGVHIYNQLQHSASDGAAGVGQMQWVFRDNTYIFNNQYEVNSGLGNLGVQDIPLPALSELNSTDPGRTTDMQNAVEDLHGFPDIPGAFGRYFETKYDNAGYAYLHKAHGLYGVSPTSGTTYGVWSVFPTEEGLAGGPTKQQLWATGNLDMVEVLSGHLDNPLNISTPAGVVYNRIVGPNYIHINTLGTAYSQTGNTIANQADMYADAVATEAAYAPLYDNVAPLVAAGYTPSSARGSVSIQVNGVNGPQYTAWAVLSDPATNFQVSYVGMQYWADISANGTATFTGVVPGTYRLSVYVLGQWGEFRQDGIVVTANNTTTVPVATFVPENFGSNVFNIGIPDRSSHEFLHGHFATTKNPHMQAGQDDREFQGNWNYWADFANTSTPGAVVYYATAVGSNPQSDYTTQWNYNHWGSSFDPTLYDPINDTADGYSNYSTPFGNSIPTYVASLPGASGTNGVTTPLPAWQVYFATPANISTYSSGYVDLSIAVACAEGSYVVNLNGHQLIWHDTNGSDCMVRSGLSGYTQWFVMEWPVSDLNPTVGASNEITVSMSQAEGSSDDAWRLELSNTGANPNNTGWNDYTYIIGSNTPATPPAAPNSSGLYNNDAVPNP